MASWIFSIFFFKENPYGIGSWRAPFNLRFGGMFCFFKFYSSYRGSSFQAAPPSLLWQKAALLHFSFPDLKLFFDSLPRANLIHPRTTVSLSFERFWKALTHKVSTHRPFPVVISCAGFELC